MTPRSTRQGSTARHNQLKNITPTASADLSATTDSRTSEPG
jgi:hypothetical protein